MCIGLIILNNVHIAVFIGLSLAQLSVCAWLLRN